MSSNTPEQQAISLIERDGSYTESEVEQVFNALQVLPSPEFMFGSWNGGVLETGHPGGKALKETEWAGRDIRGINDADPIICVNDENKRHWNEGWGHASLREMVFRGRTSVALIYDNHPICEHFRYVNENLVMEALDAPKLVPPGITLYTYLSRRK
ncbi:MAG: hypothetical protein LQ352_007830 [Teloschistes flavicans]|nr:MAG: hypothetical protein LQ352_007830 [Teloschistes flavicans]